MPTHHKEILLLFFKIKKYKMTERSIDLQHPLGEKKNGLLICGCGIGKVKFPSYRNFFFSWFPHL